jgi:S1-C subfamily serine protease
MRYSYFIIIAFILFACVPHTPFELDAMTPVPVRESYISLQDNSGILSRIGSAVIIKDGYAITTRHVVERYDGMKGYMAGGIEFPVTKVILSERLDLALFEIPRGIGKPVKIGERVKKGDGIFGAGTSNGLTLYEGIVRKTDLTIHHVDLELLNPPGRDNKGRPITYGFICEGDFKKGFSGGPVVNSRGEVVGIIQGYATELFSDGIDNDLTTIGNYGTAYHITDILDEIKRLH